MKFSLDEPLKYLRHVNNCAVFALKAIQENQ